MLATTAETQVRFPPQRLKPKLYSQTQPAPDHSEKRMRWEVWADFRKVPGGDSADIMYEHMSPGLFLRDGIGSTTLAFDVEVETIELTRWLLLPEGKEYRSYQLIRYPTGKPEATEHVKVTSQFVADDFTILAFKLLALKPGYTYEVTWFYR